MAKSFKNLKAEIPPERLVKIEERAEELLIQMALQDIRQTRSLTQQELAQMLNINQAALSKMEHQTDMRVSTLRRILAGMGGTLKLVAQFPDGEVVINQFEKL